jgi:3-hydroxyacyl-CoA dehydrogenase
MDHGIRRVAVLGAGVMGSGIAAHLANAGIESLLYDIVPQDAGDDPNADAAARSALARKGIETARKIKPAAFFHPANARLVTPCNYDDHADLLAGCDWIIEVVVERLDIKQKVYEWVAANRAEGSIVSSNTSGISLASMAEGMPEEMRRHFLVTHFFNPVRYLRLLELVSGPDTDPAVVERIATFGEDVLGKGIVYGKDTPNFVANRIGTFGMASVFHHLPDSGLTLTDIDAAFGTPMGRARSAIFRTADVVGLDTLAHVFETGRQAGDEKADWFQVPGFLQQLVDAGATGQKAGAGFYKKTRDPETGKRVILALDIDSGEYVPQEKKKWGSIGAAKKAGRTGKAIKALLTHDDELARFAWKVTADTLLYAARRIPEIADDIVNVDRAMQWGFGWELGPFETWDAYGVAEGVARMKEDGHDIPAWVEEMLAAGRESFYARDEDGTLTYRDLSGEARPVPSSDKEIHLAELKARGQEIARNASASLYDLGDRVLLLEFHSKLNALDNLIFDQYEAALDKLDQGEFDALVVGNQDRKAFCAGANILAILMGSMQQAWDQIDESVARLQRIMMRAKYHRCPVVTSPHQLTLGGGAEVAMHSAATVASGETYMGLVEVGVGVVPAGGGCKELLVRYLGDIPEGVDYDPNPFIQKIFEHIGLANVATSAGEARARGLLRPTDRIVLNPDQLIAQAKRTALGLLQAGWTPPAPRTVKVPGSQCRAAIELYLYQMHEGGYATEHDVVVGKWLAWVLTGGDAPAGATLTEEDLLALERKAFVELCKTPATQARIQHMLQHNKPLRN